ncbi:hypothetical protein LBMAG53_15210 [Planctomycetota bacterium]|nr:hypothetical protein LBMAG53_15210 [Planctomycetota bacterium]
MSHPAATKIPVRQARTDILVLWAVLLAALTMPAGIAADPAIDRPGMRKFLDNYCIECHRGPKPKSGLDLTGLDIAEFPDRWREVALAISNRDMPPAKHRKQPPESERKATADGIVAVLRRMALADAGDPGVVPVRRLTKVELEHELDDLTGLDLPWTSELPDDASGGEGFTNAAEALQLSSAWIEKMMVIAIRAANSCECWPGTGLSFTANPMRDEDRTGRAMVALTRLDDLWTRLKLPGKVPGQAVRDEHSLQVWRDADLKPTPRSWPVRQPHPDPAELAQVGDDLRRQWDGLWSDLSCIAMTPRAEKNAMLATVLSKVPYQYGSDPVFEAALQAVAKGVRLQDLNLQEAGDRGVRSLGQGIRSLTVGSLVPLLDGVLPKESSAKGPWLDRFGQVDVLGVIQVPHAFAFAEFLAVYLDDQQIERVWTMVTDPGSRFNAKYQAQVTAEQRAAWDLLTKAQADRNEQHRIGLRLASVEFARRAWRQPLSDAQRTLIERQFEARMAGGETPETAARSMVIRILTSPRFIYRCEAARARTGPISPVELANRLAFLLWSSPPDAELLRAAERDELKQPEHLTGQVRRMVQDARIRRFSAEFFGQWLGFYQFDRHDRPDKDRYPEFTPELRQAMYDESLVFCTDLVVNDRPLADLLGSRHAFLSPRLATFYGLPASQIDSAWDAAKISANADLKAWFGGYSRYHLGDGPRGGVLGWGSILTRLSHPLRTSPVRRGNWILSEILGQPTPQPPNDVPELPKDEKNDAGLSQRDLLKRHRESPACATCHSRIDPLGIALEQFDAIGRWRTADANGNPINCTDTLLQGSTLAGVDGLRPYLLAAPQRSLFLTKLCRKLLGYALGRRVAISDDPLLERMHQIASQPDGTMTALIGLVVSSPQFLNHRGEEPMPKRVQP